MSTIRPSVIWYVKMISSHGEITITFILSSAPAKLTDTCTTCNNEENRSKRVEIKELIREMKKKNPFVEGNIFK